MMLVTTSMSLLLLSFVYSVSGNCLVGGCGSGMCCSAYGYCGTGTDYCGAGWYGGAGAGTGTGGCRTSGCPAGQCCSQHGYCGTGVDYCGGAVVGGGGAVYPGGSTCGGTGCPAGSCCSAYGFCGNTAAHCGGGGAVVGTSGGSSYGNCWSTGCAAGLCCSRHGYCGSTADHCALARFLPGKQPASLEGEFHGQATYYNETKASSMYTTCGTARARSFDENAEKIYTAALNEAQFDPYTVDGIPSTNPICQKKAIAKGIKGEIVVQFVDRCRGCKEGDIALTHDGFLAVAGELGNGHTDITWHFI